MLGLDQPNKVYLIDFGLSIQYLDEQGIHISPNKNYNCVVGTALFASIDAHDGHELSRKDDIESLVYTLIYLLLGGLPWKNINISNKKDRHLVMKMMKEEFCSNEGIQQEFIANGNIPKEFFDILHYCRSL